MSLVLPTILNHTAIAADAVEISANGYREKIRYLSTVVVGESRALTVHDDILAAGLEVDEP